MSMTDPLADMIARIRNAIRARKNSVVVPVSNLKKNVAQLLAREGYLTEASSSVEDPRNLLLFFKKDSKERYAIQCIQRISKPGQRKYVNKENLPHVCSGLGVAVLSTSRGIMTDREARKLGVGGEILCEVW